MTDAATPPPADDEQTAAAAPEAADPLDEPSPLPPEDEAQAAMPDEPANGTVVVPPTPPAGDVEGAALPWLDRFRAGIAGKLAAKGVTPARLAALALGPAAVGGVCIAIDHFGLGAALGLLGLAAGWLATAPGPARADGARRPPEAFARILAHAQVPLLLGGCVLAAAGDSAPARAAVAAWAMAVLLLLPLVRARSPAGTLAAGPTVWSFSERLSALLLGLLLGHPTLAPFVVAVIGTADLLLRLAFLRPRPVERPALPPALQKLFAPDGRPQPGVRLACRLGLAFLILVYVVLERSAGWRF